MGQKIVNMVKYNSITRVDRVTHNLHGLVPSFFETSKYATRKYLRQGLPLAGRRN